MLKIAQGAEAVLYRDGDRIIKERLSKGYRIPQLDENLRKFRTRREAKVLQRLKEMEFPAPHLQEFSDKRMSITMDFIPGKKLRDVFLEGGNYQQLAQEFGQKVGRLHTEDIIHGDLTTSNMIVHQLTGELNFIDFGLSSFSEKIEDKAVDLFLLDRALESKHYLFYPEIFDRVVEGYKETNPEAEDVLKRFEEVCKRGRNKKK
ncbi:MAG TPA: KEOPS complex kinase/ATPase Bud32 [Candidatus Nanoarchaeia archaeon]|nr:KEOPS complex kinase/ATPase Bud32 [Candidatus Nanoarchaeia archaeon]